MGPVAENDLAALVGAVLLRSLFRCVVLSLFDSLGCSIMAPARKINSQLAPDGSDVQAIIAQAVAIATQALAIAVAAQQNGQTTVPKGLELPVTGQPLLRLQGPSPSKCCTVPTVIVQSRDGGLVSQNCSKCGHPDYIRLSELPPLACPRCKVQLQITDTKNNRKNYWYICPQCNSETLLANVVPHWSELFDECGLYADGGGTSSLSPEALQFLRGIRYVPGS